MSRSHILRYVTLLVAAILLRGLPVAYALPQVAAPVAHASAASGMLSHHEGQTGCEEYAFHAQPAQHASHGGEKACQIACDLSAAIALPSIAALNGDVAPSALVPTLARLVLADAPPPDHPPPIL